MCAMCMCMGPGGRVRSQGSIEDYIPMWEASLQSRPLMVNVLGGGGISIPVFFCHPHFRPQYLIFQRSAGGAPYFCG